MTDLHEGFRSLLSEEPPTRVDPRAALSAGRQRRAQRRHRWAAGGVVAALVVGAVAFVGFPHLGGEPVVPAAGTGVSIQWTEAPAQSSGALDTAATLAQLRGANQRIQEALSLPAASSAAPFSVDSTSGALQLSYRAVGDVLVEVHVIIQGPQVLFGADCPAVPHRPVPTAWPTLISERRSGGYEACPHGPVVATSAQVGGLVDHTVAQNGSGGGAIAITVTSGRDAAPPVTVAQVRAAIALLDGHLVFEGEYATATPSPSPTSSSASGTVTYTGPVTSARYFDLFGTHLTPPTATAGLTWKQAYAVCRADIRLGCADGDHTRIVLAEVTMPTTGTTPVLLYIVYAEGHGAQCGMPSGGPALISPAPPPTPDRTCDQGTLVNAVTGHVLLSGSAVPAKGL